MTDLVKARWLGVVGVSLVACGSVRAEATGALSVDASTDTGHHADAAHVGDSSAPHHDASDGGRDSAHSGTDATHDAASTRDAAATEAGPRDAGHDAGGPGEDSGSDAQPEVGSFGDAAIGCGYCKLPPPPTCLSASTIQVYAGTGSCVDGGCAYTSSTVACAAGCANGACTQGGWTSTSVGVGFDLYAVWGDSASDVWAVGQNGAVHFDGTTWTESSPSGLITYLGAVTGSGPDDVYVTEAGGSVWHYDGTAWSTSPLGYSELGVPGLFEASPSSFWIAGFVRDAEGFANTAVLLPATPSLFGTVEMASAVENAAAFTVTAVYAVGPNDIWVGATEMLHSNGTTLFPTTAPGAISLWASSATAIFGATGGTDVVIYDGASWTSSDTGTEGQTEAVSGTSPSRVFVAISPVDEMGAGELRSYDGTSWTNEPIPADAPPLYGVYAAPTGEVFAVGLGGVVLKGP
jgi:hypothetical protein